MGAGGVGRYDGLVRRYLTPRCLGMHVTLLILLPAFAWLTWWQYTRATSGNSLSWAYVFLWPAFGIYAVYTWWHLVQDQVARQVGADGIPGAASSTTVPEPAPGSRPPGWALTGGRGRTSPSQPARRSMPSGGARASGSPPRPPRKPPAWTSTTGTLPRWP